MQAKGFALAARSPQTLGEVERLVPAPRPTGVQEAPTEPTTGSAAALGYASVSAGDGPRRSAYEGQARAIEDACEVKGLGLQEVVRDIEPRAGSDLRRPGLTYALEQIAIGRAACLVVSGLDRLARSAAELGTLVEWFERHGARLVAIDVDLDTATPEGRGATRALAAAGGLDRRKLAERTRKGLAAARAKGGSAGRPAVSDRPALRKRIAAMRRDGMTLQAIADALNADGVPTARGGSEWRPSSVQAAAGYKRPGRNRALDGLPPAIGNGHPERGGKEGGRM